MPQPMIITAISKPFIAFTPSFVSWFAVFMVPCVSVTVLFLFPASLLFKRKNNRKVFDLPV